MSAQSFVWKNFLGGSSVKVNPLVILLGVPSGFEHLHLPNIMLYTRYVMVSETKAV